MRTIILFIICTLAVATRANAQDTIRFTWKGGMSMKDIYVCATSGTGNISVNWDAGNTNTYFTYNGAGNTRVLLSHTYSKKGNYDVVIATPAGTTLTYLLCASNEITSLDISRATALEYLDCASNQLTSLDVSQNAELIMLYCSLNQLTSLDVSQNKMLYGLYCQDNKLTRLDVSKNKELRWLDCHLNQLPLSQLYPIWLKDINVECILTPQTIYETFILNTTVDLSKELAFGDPAVQTQFAITMTDGASTGDKYTFANGILTFTEPGNYKVVMQNDNVQSGTYKYHIKALTIAYYHVELDATLANLTISEGTLTPAFKASVTEYTMAVENSVTEITIGATANNANAMLEGTGRKGLDVGENVFDIVVTAEDGTTKTYKITVSRAFPTGNADVKAESSISVYPNPVKEYVYIKNIPSPTTVSIHTLSGKLVWKNQVQENAEIYIGNFPTGMYLINIGREVFKIVIKH